MRQHIALFSVLLCFARLAPAQTLPGSLPLPPRAGAPAETPPAREQEALVTFDDRVTDLQWVDNRWQLTAGNVVLKDFGPHEAEGREALRLVRELHLNQVGSVGAPQPVMEYWLSDGHAPQGLVAGVRVLPIDQGTLKVDQYQGMWYVRDSNRVLFNFGTHQPQAQQALAVLHRYGFTQVGYLGHGTPLMLVFLGNAATPATTHGGSMFPRTRSITTHVPKTENGSGILPAGLQQPASPQLAALPQGRQLAAPNTLPVDPATAVERIPIDWRQAQVRQDAQGWKLIQGNYTVAEFGSSETDARLALAALHFYHFSEQCLIGHPRPTCTYFLVNGQAPHGYMLGVDQVGFQPQALAVRQIGQAWVVGDDNRPLLNFGEQAGDARQALAAIQRYQFNTLCRIGRGEASGMTFFVKAR